MSDNISVMTQEYDFLNRSVHISVQIDTNRINSRQKIAAMNRLEEWHRNEIIDLSMSEVAQVEALDGADRVRRNKAFGYIFSETLAETAQERARLRDIEYAIFPNGAKSANEQNDAEIVFNADKYQAIFVTADGGSKRQPRGILGSREELAQLGIRVMSADEAVIDIAREIAARDRNILEGCYRYGITPPLWVGLDAPEYPVDFAAFVRDRAQDVPVVVKCFSCNGELTTTLRGLRSGVRSVCPSCMVNLQPWHTDTSCSLCGGEGVLVVNGAIWICAVPQVGVRTTSIQQGSETDSR